MKRLGMAVVLLLAFAVCAQAAHGAEIKDLLMGKVHPLSMQLKDLDQTWCRFTPAGESQNPMMMYAAMLGGGGAGNVYYTKGETVAVGGETYLIAYGQRMDQADMMAVLESGRPSAGEPLTPESALSLSLLNFRTMGSLMDIRPFNLEEELAASAEMSGGETRADSLSNLKNLALAVQMFLADWDDVMPDLTDAIAALESLEEYVMSDEVFFHPETGQPYSVNSTLSQKRLADLGDPVNTAVFYEAEAVHDGTRGVAFLDGHAARVTDAEWQEIKGKSGIE